MMFEGFPEGKVDFTRIPEPFFSELLPQINHLGELKVTIYALWWLEHCQDAFRYLTEADFLADERFLSGMGATPQEAEAALRESVGRAVARGTLLQATVKLGADDTSVYFFNTPRGRAAVQAIQEGHWRQTEDARIAVELVSERPNIFKLYEQNIGPLTPLLAETLAEAEQTYPAEWLAEAFRIAVEKNARNWRYVDAILRRWLERGYDVREDQGDLEKRRQQYADWEE